MEFDRPTESRVTLELTPLIDVIFQLLIFFMLSSSFLYPNVQLKLPELSHKSEHVKSQYLVLTVSKDQQYYINRESISVSDLFGELQKRLTLLQDKSIFIRIDREVSYGKFMELMEIIRKAGASNYYLIYESSN